MEIPDDITTSFDLLIKPDVTTTVTVPSGSECVITNATLDVTDQVQGRSVVYINHDEHEVALFPLTVSKLESVTTDLHFSEGCTFDLYLKGGSIPVQVSGYLSGTFNLQTTSKDNKHTI